MRYMCDASTARLDDICSGEAMTTGRLSSARLRLVPVTVADAAEMVPVLSGAALYAFTGGAPPGLDELRARYARQAAGRSPDGRQEWRNWILRREPGGEAIGYVQATITEEGRRAEIAWVVGLAWQGQGYATEAAQALVGWLDSRGTAVIQAHIRPGHAASAAVAWRAGLRPAGPAQAGEQVWARHRPGPGARGRLQMNAAGPGAVLLSQAEVVLYGAGDPLLLAPPGLGPDGGRHADGQGARRDHHVLADQRRRGDDAPGLHPGPVQHQRAGPDEAAVLDHAAFQVRPVPHHAVGADQRGPLSRGVHDRAVLDVGPVPDPDRPGVAAEHRPRPHRGPGAERHVADDHRVRVHVGLRVDRRDQVVERVNGHGHSPGLQTWPTLRREHNGDILRPRGRPGQARGQNRTYS